MPLNDQTHRGPGSVNPKNIKPTYIGCSYSCYTRYHEIYKQTSKYTRSTYFSLHTLGCTTLSRVRYRCSGNINEPYITGFEHPNRRNQNKLFKQTSRFVQCATRVYPLLADYFIITVVNINTPYTRVLPAGIYNVYTIMFTHVRIRDKVIRA